LVIASFAQNNLPCCIDFNKSTTFPSGTIYNQSNDSITSFCWYESRTDNLVINNTPKYGSGRLVTGPAGFGNDQVLNTNNCTLRLKSIGNKKLVTITIDYLDLGGTENLSINGNLYSGELNNAPSRLGNTSVTVTSGPIPLPAKGKTGTITLNGIITELKIGGQEFYLDNICILNNLQPKKPGEIKPKFRK
jgi:hypothetical protein